MRIGTGGWMRGAAAMLLAAMLAAPVARAQAPAVDLAAVRSDLQDVQAAAPKATGGRDLDALRTQAFAVQGEADDAATKLGAQLATADARLAQLGKAAPNDPEPVREERRRLATQHDALDGQVKAAKLLSVQAGQAADDIAERRRQVFNGRLLQRAASPLSPEFWADVTGNVPHDLRRLDMIRRQAVAEALRADPRQAWPLLAGAGLIALVLVWPVRRMLEALGRRRAVSEAPSSSLRRSGYAVWMLAVDTLIPAAAMIVLRQALAWSGVLSAGAADLATALVIGVVWGAALTALGGVLLSVDRPSWRLAPISDRAAERFRPYPWAVAVVTVAGFLLEKVNQVAGASLPAAVAADDLLALVYAAVVGAALVALGRGRTREERTDARAAARASAWSLVAVVVSLAAATAAIAALTGYSALAIFVARQVFWILALCAAGYLGLEFVDDLCVALFRPDGRIGRGLFTVFGARTSTIRQLQVLSSAALRVLLALALLSFMLAPFGQGGSALFGRFSGIGHGFHVGSVLISPGALLAGVATLLVGLGLVRAFQRWLDTKYLPVTGWDASVSNSVTTAVGYLGAISAVLWALATAGLGLERIALIASALSVGIGFGLQQIVQNFVSGLILLVERPVKIGDWISVGGVDGNVRHIRVRATEIETFDRSTLLVPNSELVTKTVQNKTLHGAIGRMTIQLSVADPNRAEAARKAILGACEAVEGVLADPEPKVFIDSISEGAVNLKSFAYAASARDVFSTRSAVYFETLRRLKTAGIAIAGSSTTMVLEPGAGLGSLFASRGEDAGDGGEAAS
ncbi:MAG: mechanosensitive ion channel family protein [Caulobacteraceae bacterium]|nr:mechanosensitive ion channel family protein [Caulobacter sp.]